MNIDTNNGGESTTTEITKNGDLEIITLRKANPSKKIAKLKKAISPTQLVFNGYVKKGITILKSLQKQRRNFLNLYIDMVTDENLARKGTEDKQFKKYMKQFSVEVGLSKSSHSKLLAIALNKGIVNNRDNLPSSWGSLYDLRDFNNDQICDLIERDDGITQNSTLEDVRSVIRQDSSEESSNESTGFPDEMYSIDVIDSGEFEVNSKEENVFVKFATAMKSAETDLLKHGLVITTKTVIEIDWDPDLTAVVNKAA